MFKFSAEDITSDYRILLWLVNTFPFDTDEYYLVCYKVSDSKTFLETLYLYYLMFANHHVYYRLARLTWTFKNVLDPFHLQRNKLYRKYKPVRITWKEQLLIWNSETTQKPKHLSLKLPNRNNYFSSYKAWKNKYDMQLFKFFHT